MFYRFINRKIEYKENVTRLKEVYENSKEMSEVLYKNFQKVFTTESDFKKPQGQVRKNEMLEIRINREEKKGMTKTLDERKVIEPNGVLEYILKECRQELAEPIHDIIECSIKTGKFSKAWKRAEIMPIDKNGNKEESLNHRPVSLTNIVCVRKSSRNSGLIT